MKPVSTMLSPDVTSISLLLGTNLRLSCVQGTHALYYKIINLELMFSACPACLVSASAGVTLGNVLGSDESGGDRCPEFPQTGLPTWGWMDLRRGRGGGRPLWRGLMELGDQSSHRPNRSPQKISKPALTRAGTLQQMIWPGLRLA